MENEEILRLFLYSCKSVCQTGHSSQLFGLEVFFRVHYSSREIQSPLVNWKRKIPSAYYSVMLPASDSISQDRDGPTSMRAAFHHALTNTLNEQLAKWLLVRRKEPWPSAKTFGGELIFRINSRPVVKGLLQDCCTYLMVGFDLY